MVIFKYMATVPYAGQCCIQWSSWKLDVKIVSLKKLFLLNQKTALLMINTIYHSLKIIKLVIK